MKIKRLIFLTCYVATLSSCDGVNSQNDAEYLRKISFDLAAINNAGLRGPPHGLVTVDYEFCIPAKAQYAKAVQKIDPSVSIFYASKGRIGCKNNQYLCIGNTGQKEFSRVLHKLAQQKYIDRIDEVFWE